MLPDGLGSEAVEQGATTNFSLLALDWRNEDIALSKEVYLGSFIRKHVQDVVFIYAAKLTRRVVQTFDEL